MASRTARAGDAVDAALSSVDAMLSRYTSGPIEREPSAPRPPWTLPLAPASPPAIFMAGAAPKKDPGRADPEASREATPPAPAAGPPPPGHSSGGSPRRARDEKASDADGDLEAAPGLGEAALDAFLQAHVEYLGDRRYRCVLDGKILSKFSIMRVHVAKKFAGLVHQWAKDQAAVVAGDGEGAPANGVNISPYPGRAAAPAAEPSPSPAAEPSPKPEASRRELSPVAVVHRIPWQ